jgi:hypothetical protein
MIFHKIKNTNSNQHFFLNNIQEMQIEIKHNKNREAIVCITKISKFILTETPAVNAKLGHSDFTGGQG